VPILAEEAVEGTRFKENGEIFISVFNAPGK
jgi:hypothetical protein